MPTSLYPICLSMTPYSVLMKSWEENIVAQPNKMVGYLPRSILLLAFATIVKDPLWTAVSSSLQLLRFSRVNQLPASAILLSFSASFSLPVDPFFISDLTCNFMPCSSSELYIRRKRRRNWGKSSSPAIDRGADRLKNMGRLADALLVCFRLAGRKRGSKSNVLLF